MNDHHTKIRSLQAECELQAAARVQDATNKELEDLKLANALETIDTQLKNHETEITQMKERDDRL